MTPDADPHSIARTLQAQVGGAPLHKRIFYAGVIVLIGGLIGAALIYVFSSDDAAGRAGSEIFNRQHHEFQIERIGGKMMVYMVRFNEWFFSLWQGRQLAYTVGVLSIVIALACFWFADLVSVPLPQRCGRRPQKLSNVRMRVIAMNTVRAAILMIATAAVPAFAQTIQQQQIQQAPVNPAIDMAGFLRVSQRAAVHRESRRVSEDEFARMSREPGTIVLDARSREKYDELHIRQAINLSFPDIAIESLKKTIPDKKARILIYCNNNFRNAEGPFPSKLPSASLNLSTYIALYNYGYRNVYELRDTLELSASRLEFEPPLAKK